MKLNCTDHLKCIFSAEVTPESKAKPFFYQLDKQPFKDFPDLTKEELHEGVHTLIVCDSEGAESEVHELHVPKPLTIGEETYADDASDGTYTVCFSISGGTPPYTTKSGAIGDDNVYTGIPVENGQVIKVMIEDKVGCTASKEFVHIAVPPLSFEAVLASCTDPANGAEVHFTVQGGTPPYCCIVNGQDYGEHNESFIVNGVDAGTHTVIIRDGAEVVSAPQTVNVPEPLTIGDETYTDGASESTYTISFRISGGTIDGDNVYTSAPVQSGDMIKVEITDDVGCTTSMKFVVPVSSCDLPCEGDSKRCAYRLWLQPSDLDGMSYTQTSDVDVYFKDENNNEVNITLDDSLSLEIDPNDPQKDFHSAISGAVKQLNNNINSEIQTHFGNESSYNPLVIDYEFPDQEHPDFSKNPNHPGYPFCILWIEYFTCETFALKFNFSHPRYGDMQMTYTHDIAMPLDAAILVDSKTDYVMQAPSFDCSTHNQCHNTGSEKNCPDDLKFQAIIRDPILGGNIITLTGNIENYNIDNVSAWLWDSPDSQLPEPFYVGQTITVARDFKGTVRLVVITEEGCFMTTEKKLS